MCIRDRDTFGNFELTPIPGGDLDEDAVAFHGRATQAIRDVLYADAAENTQKL